MSLKVGIVGLPNVGKSTLFNALLKKQQALAANYPFATIEPNVGVVPVPDGRLIKLAETVAISRQHEGDRPELSVTRVSKEGAPVSIDTGNEAVTYTNLPPIVPATVEFYDIAGLVKGAHEGEGLGNAFLSHIRETAMICLVVRAFEDQEVVLTGSGEVKTDKETILTELMMKDLDTIQTQSSKLKAQSHNVKLKTIFEKLLEGFDRGKMAREVLSEEELEEVYDLFLLTGKPIMYVVNVSESEVSAIKEENLLARYTQLLAVPQEQVVVVSAKIEEALAGLTPPEQKAYMAELGYAESGLERLIKSAYRYLGLSSFLTAGEKEVRAWTIRQGMTAVEAAGVIHTDFAKRFIKADVIEWRDFVEYKGWKKAREAGKVRSEGRDYVMRDGEVVEFRVGT